MAGGQLFYFNAIESLPIGLAVLLESLGVVLVVGWLWAARRQRPGRLTMAGAVTAIAGLALLAGLAGSAQLSPAGNSVPSHALTPLVPESRAHPSTTTFRYRD